MQPHDYTMSFGDHLEDLRKRLVWAILGPLPIFVVCLYFGGDILQVLIDPAKEQLRAAGLPARLLATGPAETFIAYLKVALICAVLAAGPWILFQCWLFVAPGLYDKEKRFAYFLFPLSAALTVTGTAFLYYVLLPVSLGFLIFFSSNIVPESPVVAEPPAGIVIPSMPMLEADPPNPTPGQYWFNETMNELRIAKADGEGVTVMGAPLTGGGTISQQYRIGEYINLVFTLGIVFALAFQLPVVMLLASWIGVVDRRSFAPYRKHAAFACAITGAILTPADPASMILLMIPLYLLFEFGMLLMRFVTPERVARGIASEKEPPDASDD